MHFLPSLYALHQHYSSTFRQMFMPVLWDNGRQCSKSEVFLFSHFNYVCLQQDFSEPFRANRYTLWVLFTGVKFTIFSKFIWGQNLFLMGYFSELGFRRGITVSRCSYFECFLLIKIHECSHEQDFIHLPLSFSAATTGFLLFHNFSCALRDLIVSFSLLFACKRLLIALFPSLPEASGNQWVLMGRP